jgi:hypothetical protein
VSHLEVGESRELTCLAAFREARDRFSSDIIEHAHNHNADRENTNLTTDEIDLLKGSYTYSVAEFYYIIEELNFNYKAKIRSYLHRHNSDMSELLSDRVKRERAGMTIQRVKASLFSPTQIERVVEHVVDGRLRLDQSDLGRLLSQAISTETCRKTVVALAKGGLLNRINIGQVLVVSTGHLERYYRKHLTSIVTALARSPSRFSEVVR